MCLRSLSLLPFLGLYDLKVVLMFGLSFKSNSFINQSQFYLPHWPWAPCLSSVHYSDPVHHFIHTFVWIKHITFTSSATPNTLLCLASSSSWAPGSQWWFPLWMEQALLFWWVDHIIVGGDHGGDECRHQYQDDNADADLKAHLARIDPAKIAGPLETAFQDVVTTPFASSWFKN